MGNQADGPLFKDGLGTEARFFSPYEMTIHNLTKCDGTVDSRMFVAERGNNRIRVIQLPQLRVTTLAGVERIGHRSGYGNQAQFFAPSGIATVFGGGGMRINYVVDTMNHLVRQVLTMTLTRTRTRTLTLTWLAGPDGDRGAAV